MIAGQRIKGWTAGFVAVISLGVSPLPAGAAAQRTFVASHGNDANVCSLAAPCRGFARALAQTADEGEIIAVDSAGYGPVTIDKSVSIIAPAGVYAGISVLTGDGITIATNAIIVTLRGLTIAVLGGTRGIYITGFGSTVNVENCVVSNAFSAGIEFNTDSARLLVRDSIIRGTVGHGLMATGGAVHIDGSRIEQSGGQGIVAYNTRIVISRTSIASNAGNGVWVTADGPGSVTTEVSIDLAVISDNGGSGILLTTAGAGHVARAGISRSTLARNMAGVWAFSAGTSTVYVSATDNRMEQNGYGIYLQQCAGGGYVNAARNTAVGNALGFFMGEVATPTCVFRSAGDNMVRDNTVADVSGAVTKVTGD